MENWRMFGKNMRRLWQAIRRGGHNIKQVLIQMRQESRKQLPRWRADANVALSSFRKWRKQQVDEFNQTWHDWRDTFSTVDTSREKMHQMLFEDRTAVGQLFEAMLMVVIVVSVFVVMLDSVDVIHERFGWLLVTLEWIFTFIFTIEYVLRLYSARRPFRYATSFFGIIDLITVLPTYIGLFVAGAHTFLVLRILRVFRIFRLLKLVKLSRAGNTILAALLASRAKIAVFMVFVLMLVTMMGSVLYLVEAGQDSGFTSIPRSIYWAIVTLTTVGYGDIAPTTWLGQTIAAAIMIVGYAVIAVPTGIVSAEFVNETKKANADRIECPRCGKEEHEKSARFCNRCAERLPRPWAAPHVAAVKT